MKIISDVNQKKAKHEKKERWFKEHGIEVIFNALPVGDYCIVNNKIQDVFDRKSDRGIEVKKMDLLGTYNIVVDTKASMQELYGDIIGKQHARFRDECILAQNNGIKLYILVENNDGVKNLNDVFTWVNPRVEKYNYIKGKQQYGYYNYIKLPKKPPVSSQQFAKSLYTMQKKYGVEFLFTTPGKSAETVINLLMGE